MSERVMTSHSPTRSATQRTLRHEVSVIGVGYVTGADVTLKLRPAAANSGVCFVRTDLPGQPRIVVAPDRLVEQQRRTVLMEDGVKVEMVEHVLSALAGLGIDQCEIETNAAEMPGLDGSSLPVVEAILSAGIVDLEELRRPFAPARPVFVSEGDSMIALHPGPTDRLDITFTIDYDPQSGVGRQSRMLTIDPDAYLNEIAPARTFILESEVPMLRKQGLGARSTPQDLLIIRPDGEPIDNKLRYADECVRHKILDLVGDLSVFGRPIHGHVLAHKSGHVLTARLVRELAALERQAAGPIFDVTKIMDMLPHRYPFLLVDRVVDWRPEHFAVAIKNVTVNEPFFMGHWPNRPVMPGVMILEAMAQTAGIVLEDWRRRSQTAYLVGMDEIKFRRAVVPGDQIMLRANAVRIKARTAMLQTSAYVAEQVAAEAIIKFVLDDSAGIENRSRQE